LLGSSHQISNCHAHSEIKGVQCTIASQSVGVENVKLHLYHTLVAGCRRVAEGANTQRITNKARSLVKKRKMDQMDTNKRIKRTDKDD